MDGAIRRPSRQTLATIGLVAIVLPFLTQIATSTLMLLLISPLLVIFLVLSFLCIHVLLGYALDSMYPSNPRPTRPSARPLAFSTPAAWQAVVTRSLWSTQSPQNLPYLTPSYPVLSSSLNEILIMIVRDFVLEWYKKFSSSPSFPTAVSSTLHGTLDNFLGRVTTLDLPAFIVHRVLPKVTAHVERFRESEIALRGAGLERHLTESEELDLLLAGKFAGPRGKLHPAVENLASLVTKQSEEAHLRGLIDRALPHVLPPDAAASKAVRIVVREIVTCTVLAPIMDMLADPDFWNRAIDQLVSCLFKNTIRVLTSM
jgi:sorting nexin-25